MNTLVENLRFSTLFMIHYVEYFELHNVSISLHLVHLSLSLLLYLSLSLTIHLSSSFLFLLAHLRVPCKANNQTSLSKNTMVPHVMFLINPVFETVIHLAFHSFKHEFYLKTVISLPNKSKASQFK